MTANGGFDPSSGMFVPYALMRAMRDAVRGGGRVWYAKGWLWVHGFGFVCRLQSAKVDFGATARFDVPAGVLRLARKDGYGLLLPERFSAYDSKDNCIGAQDCEPTQAVYKWEQYMDPGVEKTIGFSFVELEGMRSATDIMMGAVPERKCGFTCVNIEERHDVARLVTQNADWRAEGIVYSEDDMGKGWKR